MIGTVNAPISKTFSWIGGNGTEIEMPGTVRRERLTLAEGEERTLVRETGGAEETWELTADAGDGAVLRLIQIQLSGGKSVNSVRVKCGRKARFEWYRVVLKGGPVYDSCRAELAGDGSSFAAETAFLRSGEELLDLNVEAVHLGRRTESGIHVSGVMSGRSGKIFRGTIDLRRGCKGAAGNETEEVLLLDPEVRNRSLPVILCAEEEVTGNHGASIGRLDEGLLYYLTSRGLETEAARKMMAAARLQAVIRKIPDEKIRGMLLETEEIRG